LFTPRADINNPYDTGKVKNRQLGLFDDFIELGSVSKFRDCGFEEAFLSNPILKHPKLSVDGGKYIYDFYLLMKHLRRTKNPESLVKSISSSMMYSRLKDALSTKRATAKDGTLNPMQKTKSLAKINRKCMLLRNLSKRFSELRKFINSMILGGSEMSEGDGVNLLSVHASKGLEFKEVYVIDLMDGRFPNRKLMSKGGSLEEERRLFYVAVTRAKDILYLSYAKFDKIKKMAFVASPFLREAGLVKDDEES
jgi:DNA helicase-2/ATP-dependent DNA helicase PcrA